MAVKLVTTQYGMKILTKILGLTVIKSTEKVLLLEDTNVFPSLNMRVRYSITPNGYIRRYVRYSEFCYNFGRQNYQLNPTRKDFFFHNTSRIMLEHFDDQVYRLMGPVVHFRLKTLKKNKDKLNLPIS